VKLSHLVKAAEHLTAAGLTDEADCVRSMAVEVRQELVAMKVAQIASLQAEIAALGGDGESACASVAAPCQKQPAQTIQAWMTAPRAAKACDRAPKQVALNVKHVEVSLSKMKQLGFGMDLMGAIPPQTQSSAFLGFLKALEREQIAKVLSWPTVVVADGGSFEVNNREHAMHLDVKARFLDDKHVQVNIRPRVGTPGEQTLEMDADVELEVGKTAVLGGLVQERLVAQKDPNSQGSRMVRTEVQHLILVTPELVEPATAVRPASHQEPSEEPNAKPHQEAERRIKAIRMFDILPGQPQPRVRYSFPAVTR
jgi:Flp pilus assembly secretin CpaC